MRWFDAAAQCVADFIVDERCHVCGARVKDPYARADAPALARPLGVGVPGLVRVTTRLLCGACAGRVRAWDTPVVVTAAGPDGARAVPITVYPAFETDERLLAVVHLMKFARRARVAPWLAAAMAEALPRLVVESAVAPLVLVPVPMDRASRAHRGFNQAGSIASELGRRWRLPVADDALHKRRPTRAQSALGRDERWTNLEGAFAAGPAPVTGRTVILVDDLVTTGATVHACAAALRAAGAADVRAACAGYRP